MFEKYIDEQPIAVKTLCNALENNKLSHAYIFETNNYQKSYEFVKDFIKYIACPNSTKNDHIEEQCNICTAINSDNYIELKIINPDTLQIKKEEMLALQQEFKSKAIEGKQKIYLIKNAEKLNSSSANTILKFLEEPEDNIIAILMTSSRYALLSTILSRCQIISLKNIESKEDIVQTLYKEYYSNEEENEDIIKKIEENIETVLKFVDFNESNGKDSLMFTNEYFLKYFKNREDVLIAFEIIKLIYYDALKYMVNNSLKYFESHRDLIETITKKNNIQAISRKLNVISLTIEKIKYNVNIGLLLDKYIMEMGDDSSD